MNNRLDLIRTVAILMVMLGHSIIIYDSSWGVLSSMRSADYFVQIKKVINLVQMPLFFALSGYLFIYSLRKKPSVLKFVKSKALRLIVPYILVGCLIMLPIKILLEVPGHVVCNVSEGIRLYKGFLRLSNGLGHLWFLSTLFCLMLLAFLLVQVKRVVWWDSLLILIVLSATQLPKHYAEYVPCLSLICDYALYFFMGIMMSKYSMDTGSILKWPLVFCLLFALTSVFSYTRELLPLLSCSLVFFIFRFTPNVENRFISIISKNSFGLYLFHSPLIYFAFTHTPNIHPVLMLFINFCVCGVLAFCFTEFVRKYRISKLMIGE